jgi:uncharacterized membrane protein
MLPFQKPFFSSVQKALIAAAIKNAEQNTSGEIKVHIEPTTKHELAIDRAKEIFASQKLFETIERNAVLIYVAYTDRKFAIYGDEGIHEKVGDDFWHKTIELMHSHFSKGDFVHGIIAGVNDIGLRLKEHFPYENKGSLNEISDEISEG